MKRRNFILLTTAGIVGAAVPLIHRWEGLSGWGSPFAQPHVLSLITTRKNIKLLGRIYIERFPGESNYNTLFDLLSDKQLNSKLFHESDTDLIRSKLGSKIMDDVHHEKTLILDGWVLSVTEARQCALYYLLQS
jgi:hypothetical protein